MVVKLSRVSYSRRHATNHQPLAILGQLEPIDKGVLGLES
jgi:hypothetical protein